jgi:hypothetical protein
MSVETGEAGEWLLRIIPRKDALNVSVSVHTEKRIVEYPLTVTPPLTSFVPPADDGRNRYLREFVERANELATQQATVKASH